MGRPPKFPQKGIDVGVQIGRMRELFPKFKYFRCNGQRWWQGKLQPTVCSPEYEIKILYRNTKLPKIFVLRPEIDPKTPHRYPDGSLCVCYPKDQNWGPRTRIAETIILWIAEWLLFYEFWKETGKWWGEEVSHKGPKISD